MNAQKMSSLSAALCVPFCRRVNQFSVARGAVLFWNSSRLSKDKSGEVAHISAVAADDNPLQVPKTNQVPKTKNGLTQAPRRYRRPARLSHRRLGRSQAVRHDTKRF